MITSIRMESFRGIQSGALEGLTRLCVLVGPSGCGKGSVLEALLLGASPDLGEAVGRVVRRHTGLPNGARWVFWRGGRMNVPARLSVTLDTGTQLTLSLRLASTVAESLREELLREERPSPYSQITAVTYDTKTLRGPLPAVSTGVASPEALAETQTAFSADNGYAARTAAAAPGLSARPRVHLVDTRGTDALGELPALYREALESGRLQEINQLVAEVMPGLEDIRLEVEADVPVLYLNLGSHSVPLALAGDGIQSLVRLCLELASLEGGTALLEEPEAHQHPTVVYQSARAIITAVRRGVQVILSTHSMEFVDALLYELKQEELPLLSTYGMRLSAGKLLSTQYTGSEVALCRGEIGKDLR